MECLDNPVVTAFLKNEMYCDWCNALTIAYNELCLPGELVQLVQKRRPKHDSQLIQNEASLVKLTYNPSVREAETGGALYTCWPA